MAEYIAENIYTEDGLIKGVENHGELIRCKDCKKHYNELKCPCGGYRSDDWFCADRERKGMLVKLNECNGL